MKIKELINLVENYEDYDVDFSLGCIEDNTPYGISCVTFRDIVIADISHSEKGLRLSFNDTLDGNLKIEY